MVMQCLIRFKKKKKTKEKKKTKKKTTEIVTSPCGYAPLYNQIQLCYICVFHDKISNFEVLPFSPRVRAKMLLRGICEEKTPLLLRARLSVLIII